MQVDGTKVRMVSGFDETQLDARSWNALAAHGTNFVFQTHQWCRSWWSCYGNRFEPLIIATSNGSTTTGVAPLVVAENGGDRVIQFLGDGRSDYCDLLLGDDPATLVAMFRTIRDYGRWDLIDLQNIPSQSRTVEMIRAVCRELRLPVLVRDQFVCPTLLIRGHEATALRVLNKPSLRRRQARFEKMGRLRSRDLVTAAEVGPYLELFFEQHIARWSLTNTPSLFLDSSNRAFYRELTERLDGTGWLLFSSIELDDRPIAFHYGFDYAEAQIWYKPSFDPTLASRSPGLVLVRHLIQRAIEQRRREFDFTVGDEPFKKRFTNLARKTVHIQVFRDHARHAYERSRRTVIDAMRHLTSNWRVQL